MSKDTCLKKVCNSQFSRCAAANPPEASGLIRGGTRGGPTLGHVVNWFRRARERIEVPRLTPRSEQRPTAKVDLAELTPSLTAFLGNAAYLQLSFFETIGRATSIAPTLAAKETLAKVAARALDKHRKLIAELERRGDDPVQAMEPFAAGVHEFQRVTRGNDWYEVLVSCYVTAGFLDDFFVRLGAGLSGEAGTRAVAILRSDAESPELVALVIDAIGANPRLSSRLAMWGRRLVGDTMLVARHALVLGPNHDTDEARIEPVFTELIAAHTRRMDNLGLTA
jgi:hypothetical protein